MCIDVIGALYDPQAEPGGAPVRLWGFHVNVIPDVLESHPDLTARVHQPATLRRVWAGDDPAAPVLTVALRFNGENTAREALGDLWPSAI